MRGIFLHLLVGRVADFLRRVFDPREHDGLAFFRLDRAPEVCRLAIRHIVAPALDLADRAELLEQRPCLGCRKSI